MPLNCVRRGFVERTEDRLYALGKQHPDRDCLESACSRANAQGCSPACDGRARCAIGPNDPVLRSLTHGLPADDPEPDTIIIND